MEVEEKTLGIQRKFVEPYVQDADTKDFFCEYCSVTCTSVEYTTRHDHRPNKKNKEKYKDKKYKCLMCTGMNVGFQHHQEDVFLQHVNGKKHLKKARSIMKRRLQKVEDKSAVGIYCENNDSWKVGPVKLYMVNGEGKSAEACFKVGWCGRGAYRTNVVTGIKFLSGDPAFKIVNPMSDATFIDHDEYKVVAVRCAPIHHVGYRFCHILFSFEDLDRCCKYSLKRSITVRVVPPNHPRARSVGDRLQGPFNIAPQQRTSPITRALELSRKRKLSSEDALPNEGDGTASVKAEAGIHEEEKKMSACGGVGANEKASTRVISAAGRVQYGKGYPEYKRLRDYNQYRPGDKVESEWGSSYSSAVSSPRTVNTSAVSTGSSDSETIPDNYVDTSFEKDLKLVGDRLRRQKEEGEVSDTSDDS